MITIKSISGNQVTLMEPLLWELKSNWTPEIWSIPVISEVGVENIRMKTAYAGPFQHHVEPNDNGWDSIRFDWVVNGWIRNIVHENCSTAVSLFDSKSCTVRDYVVLGPQGHNGFCVIHAGTYNLFYNLNGKSQFHTWMTQGGAGNAFVNCTGDEPSSNDPHGTFTWSNVAAGQYSLTARATNNGGASTTSAAASVTVNSSSSSPGGVSIKINFQPASAPTVTGYLVDSGATYAVRNSQTYGWTADVSGRTLDRNNSLSADQRYDTLINLDRTTTAWEMALPNGTYTVKLVSGDPTSTSTQSTSLTLEGAAFLNGTFSSTTHWYEKTGTVTVNDGKLTMARSGGSDSPVCFIEITQP